jgi:hypothetical protein
MKMKHKKFWFFSTLAALLVTLAFQKTLDHYQQRETQLQIANVRLHERLFVEILRGEIGRDFPGAAYTITPSGGVTEAGGNYGLTTMADAIFLESLPLDRLRAAARNLSSHQDVTGWVSLAAQRKISRFCQFHVVDKAEKPYIRMVMHETNRPDGLAEADLLRVFNGDFPQVSAIIDR